ncbi:hypothetical protein V8F20_006909 [Naviculisporaceae sp. PSN 640]
MVALKSLLTFATMAIFSASAAPSVPEPSPTPNGSADDPPVALARPIKDVGARDLEARQSVGCVLMCADHFFQGACYEFCTNNSQCANLGGGFNDWTSSLRTTTSGWTCAYYEHAGCAGASFASNYEDTLHDQGGFWADRISSIRCYSTAPCGGGPFDPPC